MFSGKGKGANKLQLIKGIRERRKFRERERVRMSQREKVCDDDEGRKEYAVEDLVATSNWAENGPYEERNGIRRTSLRVRGELSF